MMNDKQNLLGVMALMLSQAQTNNHIPFGQFIKTTPKKKRCLLKGCNNLSTKTYCCKEHCLDDKCNSNPLPKGKKKLSRKQRKKIKGQK